METKTKWIIGISAVVLGISAVATRKFWMPKKDDSKEASTSEGDSTTKSMGEKEIVTKGLPRVTTNPTVASKLSKKTASSIITSDYINKLIAQVRDAQMKLSSLGSGNMYNNQARKLATEALAKANKELSDAQIIYNYQNPNRDKTSSFEGYSGELSDLTNNNLIEL